MFLNPVPGSCVPAPKKCPHLHPISSGAESPGPLKKDLGRSRNQSKKKANNLRIDIGNAYIAGMDDDLIRGTAAGAARDGGGAGGRANYYEWALASFYIAYILFEWMSMLWSRVPAHAYVAGIVLSWGAVASLQAIATSYPILIALRFLLGVGEAGFTGIPIYLSFFFRREELALRTAVFISGKAWTLCCLL